MISRIDPISAFQDNYFWALVDDGAGKACIVDPGDAARVVEFLSRNGLQLSDILLTHHHIDHIGGVAELIGRYRPRVFGPAGIAGVEEVLRENRRIEVFGVDFRVFEVPGHTLDHIAYFHDGHRHDAPLLFCGDTLFAAGCGRLFEGSPAQMLESLGKLKALPGATEVYCAHEYTLANLAFAEAAEPGNPRLHSRIEQERGKLAKGRPTLPSSIGQELLTNPFLRCDQPGLAASAAQRLGRAASDETEVFTAIRQWKDRF